MPSNDRPVDHAAVHGDGRSLRSGGTFYNPARPFDTQLAGDERGIDYGHLSRMNTKLSPKSEPLCADSCRV